MLAHILEITRHELVVAARTRRAIVVTAMYLGSAVLGGLAFVLAVRFIEHEVLARLSTQAPGDGTTPDLALLSEPAYQKLAAFFAGVEPTQVAEAFRTAVIVPFFLWGSLIFLPFLIVFSCFDVMAGDLQSRAILYTTLRARRVEILLGKLLAQLALFLGVSVLGAAALTLIATLALQSFNLVAALPALARMLLLLAPYGLAYLALTIFASTWARQPFSALLLAIGIMVALRVVSWLDAIPAESSLALLKYAKWLSPSSYQQGLWLDDIWGPLSSSLAYTLFAAVFVGLAALSLKGRDL